MFIFSHPCQIICDLSLFKKGITSFNTYRRTELLTKHFIYVIFVFLFDEIQLIKLIFNYFSRLILKARVHRGHNSGPRHPSMIPYIFGERQDTDIIDLEQTLPRLQQALDVCAHMVQRDGMRLFITRNQLVIPWVESMAQDVGEYAHCRKFRRGELFP